MKTLLAVLSLLNLALCVAAPVYFFAGRLAEDKYKLVLLLASIAYFIFATAWASRRRQKVN